MKHWSADTLLPAIVVGWFSWWTWVRFLLDMGLGAWGGWSSGALWYFNPEEDLLFGSVPDMMCWITAIAVALAIPALTIRHVSTWQGRLMNCLAHVVIMGSVGYTIAVHRQEVLSAEATRLKIELLEEKGSGRDELDEWHLTRAQEIYERYKQRNQR